MRFHIPSLPHTHVTRDFDWCAYTAKVRRFAGMMTSLGHEVFLYSGDRNEAPVAEHVTIVRPEDREEWFGSPEWPTQQVFQHWDSSHPAWATMNERAIREIEARLQPGDFVGLISGACQAAIHNAFRDRARTVEWGIGYEGTITDFRVFESYAWMHHVAGLRGQRNVRHFDTVVPNSYDEEDFQPSYQPGGYLLFLARPTEAKGQQIVREIAARTELPVVTAGQGEAWLPGADHRGVVLGAEKARLLAGATALLSPTIYLEPFGGVTIEAMLSGTPVITTDFGAFTETVKNGLNGQRCSTLKEFLDATQWAASLTAMQRVRVRQSAERYLTKNVRYEYERYFQRLATLDDKGWYQL